MSEAKSEESKLGKWGSAALLLGTAVAALYVLPVVVPLVAAHLLLTGAAVAGAGAYVAYDEGRREKAKSLFSKISSAYKEAFSNLGKGWKSATQWAEAREAAAKAAPEAETSSTLGAKEAGPGFNASASGEKPAVKAATPAPVAKPTARPGV